MQQTVKTLWVVFCSSNRKSRGADYGLSTQSGRLPEDDGAAHEDGQSSPGGAVSGGSGVCETKYQTAVVDVYATFSVSDTPHSRYLVRHGAYLRVTDLVRSELRVSDPSLAAFTDGNQAVEGLHPGQTQVQVRIRGAIKRRENLNVSSFSFTQSVFWRCRLDWMLRRSSLFPTVFLGRSVEVIGDLA